MAEGPDADVEAERARLHQRIEELLGERGGDVDDDDERDDQLETALAPLLERLVSLLDPKALAPDSEDGTWSRSGKSFASKFIWYAWRRPRASLPDPVQAVQVRAGERRRGAGAAAQRLGQRRRPRLDCVGWRHCAGQGKRRARKSAQLSRNQSTSTWSCTRSWCGGSAFWSSVAGRGCAALWPLRWCAFSLPSVARQLTDAWTGRFHCHPDGKAAVVQPPGVERAQDLESVVPFARRNARLNAALCNGPVSAQALLWGGAETPLPCDVILGADLISNLYSSEALIEVHVSGLPPLCWPCADAGSKTLRQYPAASIYLCWESHDGRSAPAFVERASMLFAVHMLPADQMHPVYRKPGLCIAVLTNRPP